MYVCMQGPVCMNMNTVESAHVHTHMYIQHNILSHVSTLSFHLVDQQGVCVRRGMFLLQFLTRTPLSPVVTHVCVCVCVSSHLTGCPVPGLLSRP